MGLLGTKFRHLRVYMKLTGLYSTLMIVAGLQRFGTCKIISIIVTHYYYGMYSVAVVYGRKLDYISPGHFKGKFFEQ